MIPFLQRYSSGMVFFAIFKQGAPGMMLNTTTKLVKGFLPENLEAMIIRVIFSNRNEPIAPLNFPYFAHAQAPQNPHRLPHPLCPLSLSRILCAVHLQPHSIPHHSTCILHCRIFHCQMARTQRAFSLGIEYNPRMAETTLHWNVLRNITVWRNVYYIIASKK